MAGPLSKEEKKARRKAKQKVIERVNEDDAGELCGWFPRRCGVSAASRRRGAPVSRGYGRRALLVCLKVGERRGWW